MYYGLVSIEFALVYVVGLIMISAWAFKESASTRQCLLIGGWLIFGATIAMILWNVFFLFVLNKKQKNIMVGTGDDSNDYEEESRLKFMLGYVIWGSIILTFDILLLCVAYSHVSNFDE